MKIETRGISRFLSKEDVPAPLVAVIDRVTVDQTLRNPFVLHFAGGALKPLPLNVGNRRTLVAALGDEDEQARPPGRDLRRPERDELARGDRRRCPHPHSCAAAAAHVAAS